MNEALFFHEGLSLIQSSEPLNHKLAELVRLAAEACGSNMGGLWLRDPGNHHLQAAVMVGIPKDYRETWGRVELGTGVCGVVAQTLQPGFVEDMATDQRFAGFYNPDGRVRAGFSVPVIGPDGRCLGTLATHFDHAFRPDQYHFERNQLFATLIAFALQHNRLFSRANGASADD